MTTHNATVGAWYHDLGEDQFFEVVAVDENFSTVEIQYIGGEVAEIEFEAWAELPLIPAEAPEDAGAAFELSREDEWGNETIIPENWSNPISSIEPESFSGFDDF